MINWKRYSDPWYSGYAFQGAVVLGVAPILIPLIVGNAAGSAEAGLVVAAFYAGQLSAPFLGGLTDRLGIHRAVYFLGYLLLAAGLAAFPFVSGAGFWLLLALIQGMGAAATNTVAAMFIVETRPKDEWDPRIGWLQTFYGLGQALGLGLAALLQMEPGWGMVIAAALMLPGIWLGRMGLPKTEHPARAAKVPKFSRRTHRQPRTPFGMLHHYESILTKDAARILLFWRSAFGLYLLSWFLCMLGSWLIYNLYPLLMQSAYGINASLSSLYYAVAAGIGIFVYAPSGILGHKIGDGPVVMLGILASIISAGAMAFLAHFDTQYNSWLVPAFFILMPVAWSPLIVAGTALTAQLATIAEGTAMGVFNATTAIASVLAALGAGYIAEFTGYKAVPIVAVVLLLLSAAVLLPVLRLAPGGGTTSAPANDTASNENEHSAAAS